ncbi:hypothetical protein ACFSJW_04865 [Flavobacterium artemisiae]|uniref:Uncharacterized protein n=1 Tax=Flavobacterium artemisiae TaxID=2126556 RepID=A0ABW4HMG7_9FLAO
MKTLRYKIKPTIYFEDQKLWIFNNEILDMPFSIIENGILSCKQVINGEHEKLSWGLETAELLVHKETSILEYHGKFVTEIPPKEFCEILEIYRDKLKEYENEKS